MTPGPMQALTAVAHEAAKSVAAGFACGSGSPHIGWSGVSPWRRGMGRIGNRHGAHPRSRRRATETAILGASVQAANGTGDLTKWSLPVAERISDGRRGGKVRLGTILSQSRWSLHLPSQHATAARPQSDAGTPPGAGSTITVVRPELHLLAHRFNPPGPAGRFVTCRRR